MSSYTRFDNNSCINAVKQRANFGKMILVYRFCCYLYVFYQLGVLVKRVNLLSYVVFNDEFKTYLILLFSAIKWSCRYKS